MADRFFRRIYRESRLHDPERIRYCQNIANATLHAGRFKASARWFNRASDFCASHQMMNSPAAANLYLTRGIIYRIDNKNRCTLESVEKAFEMFSAHFREIHPWVAFCYSVIDDEYQ